MVFGVPVQGFAALWTCLVIAITVRTKRVGLAFSLAWSGTSAPALRTGSDPFRVYAAALCIVLVPIWIRIAALTAYSGWQR